MTTYRFQPIMARAQKSGWCPVCGKRVTRSKRFEQTVNPLNRNELGAVKSHDEVRADVNAEAVAWVPDFTHEKCDGVPADVLMKRQ